MIDKVFLPLILIVITYGLKLFIDQQVDKRIAIKSVCELPIDIIFLSISLLIAVIVSNASNRNEGLLCMVINFALAMLIVFLSKRSATNYHTGINSNWQWMLGVNLFISVLSLIISVRMIPTENSDKAIKVSQINITNGN